MLDVMEYAQREPFQDTHVTTHVIGLYTNLYDGETDSGVTMVLVVSSVHCDVHKIILRKYCYHLF